MLWWSAVAGLILLGLCLRMAAAQGGLWTDEAWSVIYAARARTPIGVFLRINHDNNHHLYSLWLQAIGIDASPLLARAPAIVAGTLAIPVAGLIAARRSSSAGLVAAILFAVSPMLVTFGSEARGYSLMLLALLLMVLIVTDSLERGCKPSTTWSLALLSGLGMLSHLTMVGGVGLIALWVYLDRRSAVGPDRALRETARVMGPAIGAAAAVLLMVAAAAAASPQGMRVGGYVPFRLADFTRALADLVSWTLGPSFGAALVGPVLVALIASVLLFRPPQWLKPNARLYAILILGVPLAVGFVRAGNPGFARYYLCSAVGLLLLAAEVIGRGLGGGRTVRIAAAVSLSGFLILAAWRDSQLIELQRGHPDAAVALIARKSPGGAQVAVGHPRLAAVIAVAASRAAIPLHIVGGCAPANFLISAQEPSTPAPALVERCGAYMRIVGSSPTTPLSGDSWALYQRVGLQRGGPAVSGRASQALNGKRFSAERA